MEMNPAKLVTFFLLVIIGHHEILCSQCPPSFEEFDGTCYGFAKSPMPWSDAMTACQTVGAVLAKPRTAKINDWFKEEMKTRKIGVAWLGANDILEEGKWFWSGDDEPISDFTDWWKGNPSNSGNNEDCMHLLGSKGKYHWNDIACTKSYMFICEKSPTTSSGMINPWF